MEEIRMKTKKTLVAALLCATMVFTAGCGGQASTTKSTGSTANSSKATSMASTTTSTASNAAADEVDGVSLANPIKVDKEAKTITVLCSINGQYFTQPTRHASIFKDGGFGTKSIFTSYGKPLDFYDALIEIKKVETGQPITKKLHLLKVIL